MNRKGVRGMTLGDVAARLDLVPTAVIYYFKNKEELAGAAFLKGLEAYEALIAAAAGSAASLRAASSEAGGGAAAAISAAVVGAGGAATATGCGAAA